VPDNPHLDISLAGPTDLPAVRSFYADVGYGGGLDATDRILVGRGDDAIIAAVRLSRENGTLVLRGMYVAAPLRGLGIGRALLDRVSVEIGPSCCWCIPFSHLEKFYARIGFGVLEGGEIPEFLAARKDRYEAAGHDVVIMCRPA
jgi:GNAT superfamily N-acetyltransferase